jgi:hypothetical protein
LFARASLTQSRAAAPSAAREKRALRRLLKLPINESDHETGGGGGERLMRHSAMTIPITAITAMMPSMFIADSYSSPFAPAQETLAPVTGGRNIAPTPAPAARTTAPQSDALTPASWYNMPESNVPRRRPHAFAM